MYFLGELWDEIFTLVYLINIHHWIKAIVKEEDYWMPSLAIDLLIYLNTHTHTHTHNLLYIMMSFWYLEL